MATECFKICIEETSKLQYMAQYSNELIDVSIQKRNTSRNNNYYNVKKINLFILITNPLPI